MDAVVVKSNAYETALAVFKERTGFSSSSTCDHIEREISDFEKYYGELEVEKPYSFYDLAFSRETT